MDAIATPLTRRQARSIFGRSRTSDRRFPCVMCGECCERQVCAWAAERRPDPTDDSGPCEHLRSTPEGRRLCGLLVDAKGATRLLMQRQAGIGRGCSNMRRVRRMQDQRRNAR